VDDTQTRIDRDLGSSEAHNCGPAGSGRRCGDIHLVRRGSVCSTDSVGPVVARKAAELDRTSVGAEGLHSGGPEEQRRRLRVSTRDGETAQTAEARTTAGDCRERGQTEAQWAAANSWGLGGASLVAAGAHIDHHLAGRGTPTWLSSGTQVAGYCVGLCAALHLVMASMRSLVDCGPSPEGEWSVTKNQKCLVRIATSYLTARISHREAFRLGFGM
jgi:hypothetical protein